MSKWSKKGEMPMEYVQEIIATEEDTTRSLTIRTSDYIMRLQTIVDFYYHRGYVHSRNLDSIYYVVLFAQICVSFHTSPFEFVSKSYLERLNKKCLVIWIVSPNNRTTLCKKINILYFIKYLWAQSDN